MRRAISARFRPAATVDSCQAPIRQRGRAVSFWRLAPMCHRGCRRLAPALVGHHPSGVCPRQGNCPAAFRGRRDRGLARHRGVEPAPHHPGRQRRDRARERRPRVRARAPARRADSRHLARLGRGPGRAAEPGRRSAGRPRGRAPVARRGGALLPRPLQPHPLAAAARAGRALHPRPPELARLPRRQPAVRRPRARAGRRRHAAVGARLPPDARATDAARARPRRVHRLLPARTVSAVGGLGPPAVERADHRRPARRSHIGFQTTRFRDNFARSALLAGQATRWRDDRLMLPDGRVVDVGVHPSRSTPPPSPPGPAARASPGRCARCGRGSATAGCCSASTASTTPRASSSACARSSSCSSSAATCAATWCWCRSPCPAAATSASTARRARRWRPPSGASTAASPCRVAPLRCTTPTPASAPTSCSPSTSWRTSAW